MPKLKLTLETATPERQIARAGEAVLLALSFPPSVNNLFANVAHGRVITKQYREWREENGWRIAAAKPRRVAGPVTIELSFEDRPGRRDLDNLLKPVLDLLVAHSIIDGDHRAVLRGIQATWDTRAGCHVVVRPVADAAAQRVSP